MNFIKKEIKLLLIRLAERTALPLLDNYLKKLCESEKKLAQLAFKAFVKTRLTKINLK